MSATTFETPTPGRALRIGLWAAQVLIAFVFISAGLVKLLTPIPQLAAMMPWQWASGCIAGSTRTLSGEAQLIRSVDVPREMWVLRMVGSNFVTFLFTLPVLYCFAAGFQKPVSWEILWVPVAMGMRHRSNSSAWRMTTSSHWGTTLRLAPRNSGTSVCTASSCPGTRMLA